MKNKLLILFGIITYALMFMGAGYKAGEIYYGATNFDRIVLGENNFGTDPVTTADITLQNDESINNATDGVVSIVSPSLKLSSTVFGTGAFTTTGDTVNVPISGALSTDVYIVSGKYVAGVDQQDVLQWSAFNGYLKVWRLASGESAGAFSWLRLRP